MMKTFKILLLGLSVLYLSGLALHRLNMHHGVAVIQNSSDQMITSVSVEICSQRFVLQDIAIGDVRAVLYDVTSDSHYVVTVDLASAKRLHIEEGYTTSGVDFIDTFVVTSDEVLFRPQLVPESVQE